MKVVEFEKKYYEVVKEGENCYFFYNNGFYAFIPKNKGNVVLDFPYKKGDKIFVVKKPKRWSSELSSNWPLIVIKENDIVEINEFKLEVNSCGDEPYISFSGFCNGEEYGFSFHNGDSWFERYNEENVMKKISVSDLIIREECPNNIFFDTYFIDRLAKRFGLYGEIVFDQETVELAKEYGFFNYFVEEGFIKEETYKIGQRFSSVDGNFVINPHGEYMICLVSSNIIQIIRVDGIDAGIYYGKMVHVKNPCKISISEMKEVAKFCI